MTNITPVVKQIGISAEDHVVAIELICFDAYGAEVLREDLVARLMSGRVLSLTVKAGAVIKNGMRS